MPVRTTAVQAGLLASLLLALPTAVPADAVPDGTLPALVLEAPEDDVEDTPAWRERLLRLFDEAVLNDESAQGGRIAKWTGPVTILLLGPVEPHLPRLEAVVAEIAALTGLALELTTDAGRDAEIEVLVSEVPARRLPPGVAAEARRPSFACAGAPTIRGGRIVRARVVINATELRPEEVSACLVEEIAQVIGLMGETRQERGTVLSDRIGYRGLGAIDRLLLRTLYDPRLTPGMPTDEALPVVAVILDELLPTLRCATGPDGHRRCGF